MCCTTLQLAVEKCKKWNGWLNGNCIISLTNNGNNGLSIMFIHTWKIDEFLLLFHYYLRVFKKNCIQFTVSQTNSVL